MNPLLRNIFNYRIIPYWVTLPKLFLDLFLRFRRRLLKHTIGFHCKKMSTNIYTDAVKNGPFIILLKTNQFKAKEKQSHTNTEYLPLWNFFHSLLLFFFFLLCWTYHSNLLNPRYLEVVLLLYIYSYACTSSITAVLFCDLWWKYFELLPSEYTKLDKNLKTNWLYSIRRLNVWTVLELFFTNNNTTNSGCIHVLSGHSVERPDVNGVNI